MTNDKDRLISDRNNNFIVCDTGKRHSKTIHDLPVEVRQKILCFAYIVSILDIDSVVDLSKKYDITFKFCVIDIIEK